MFEFVTRLVLSPIFSVLGLVYDVLFWPVLWLLCGLSLVILAMLRGEKPTIKQVKLALALGPIPYIFWGITAILDYLGVSVISQVQKVLAYKNKVTESVKETVKGTAQGCKDTAASCKNTAVSYKDKAGQAAGSLRDRAVACKDQAVGYIKNKFKKADKSEDKAEDKEDEKK